MNGLLQWVPLKNSKALGGLNACPIDTGGLVRDLNPGPLAPKARIIPLDQRATKRAVPTLFYFFQIPIRNCIIQANANFFSSKRGLGSD